MLPFPARLYYVIECVLLYVLNMCQHVLVWLYKLIIQADYTQLTQLKHVQSDVQFLCLGFDWFQVVLYSLHHGDLLDCNKCCVGLSKLSNRFPPRERIDKKTY